MPILYPNNIKPLELTKENRELDISNDKYAGLNFSYPFNKGGLVFDTDKLSLPEIKSRIVLLLDTDFGERRYKPDFGIGLRLFLFEQMTEATMDRLKENIESQLKFWVPQVQIKQVLLSFDGIKLLTISVSVYLKDDARQSTTITKEVEID